MINWPYVYTYFVLASFAGHLETQEAATKLQQLSKKIDNLKLQVYDITVNKYANFVPKLHSTEQLVSDVAAIKEEMDEVSSKIENEVCIYISCMLDTDI